MHYKLRVSKAIFGDLVTVIAVCEAMANAIAKGYGQLPYDHPTYTAAIKTKTEEMAKEIQAGFLVVRDLQGGRYPNPELFQTNDVINATVTIPSLTAWGAERGDTFQMDDTDTVKIVTSGWYGRGIVVLDGRDGESMARNTGLAARPADITHVAKAPACEPLPTVAKPLSRATAQDAAILNAITSAGYDRLKLPKNNPGKPGVKATIREAVRGNLFIGETVFDKAWERLTKACDISYKT